jgi:ADP-heptose:LPS heptosyltransferase
VRLLVVRLSALGDVLHALPALELLRRGLPAAELWWAVEGPAASLLQGHPALSRVVVLDRAGLSDPVRRPGALRGALEALRVLRGARFDAVLDLQGLLRSALVARAVGAGRSFGPAWAPEGARWLYGEPLPAPRPGEAHAALRYAALARGALARLGGAQGEGEALPAPRLGLAPVAPAEPPAGALLALLPGAGKRANRPPVGLLAEVARRARAARPDLSVALIGGRGDRRRGAALAARLAGLPVRDLCGAVDLAGSAGWLRRADVVVGGDTGPLHLAAALGRPVVGLYPAADPARTGPGWAGLAPARVLAGQAECAPCRARACRRPDGVRVCLRGMPAARVAEAVLGLLPG